MTVIRYGLIAGSLVFAAALAVSPVSLRAEDAGVVVEPSDVTPLRPMRQRPRRPGAVSTRRRMRFQTELPDLQPQPTTAEPNN